MVTDGLRANTIVKITVIDEPGGWELRLGEFKTSPIRPQPYAGLAFTLNPPSITRRDP